MQTKDLKEWNKLTTECFSSDMKKLKYYTWKFKNRALLNFIDHAIQSAIEEERKELIKKIKNWCEPDSGNNKAITNLKVFLSELSKKEE